MHWMEQTESDAFDAAAAAGAGTTRSAKPSHSGKVGHDWQVVRVQNRVFFAGTINAESAQMLKMCMYQILRDMQNGGAADDNDPALDHIGAGSRGVAAAAAAEMGLLPRPPYIVLFINSIGGEAVAGYSLYDHLRAFPIPVVAVADGQTVSAASVLYMGSSWRYVMPNAVIRIHQGKYALNQYTHVAVARDAVANWEQSEKRAQRLYVSRVYMPPDADAAERKRIKQQVRRLLCKERDLSAGEAIALGFALGTWPLFMA